MCCFPRGLLDCFHLLLASGMIEGTHYNRLSDDDIPRIGQVSLKELVRTPAMGKMLQIRAKCTLTVI